MSSRKAAITLGFAAGAMAKFGMASAGTVGLLFAGKAVDRLANGIQVRAGGYAAVGLQEWRRWRGDMPSASRGGMPGARACRRGLS